MKRSRAELLLVLLASSCARALSLPGVPVTSHPAALVGEWVDESKSSARDTSLWVLGPRGDDDLVHVKRDSSGGVQVTRSHFGYWYAAEARDGSYSLCVSHRRTAGYCSPVAVEADSTSGSVVRSLIVKAYRGQHRVSDRVLRERTPGGQAP